MPLFFIIQSDLTHPEHDQPTAELLARRAIWDYLSIGPEPNLGEIEVAALDEWITACGNPHALPARQRVHIADMHLERAWSHVTEAGLLKAEESVPDDIIQAVRADLAEAGNLYDTTKQSEDRLLRAQALVTRLSLSLVDIILTQHERILGPKDMQAYLLAQAKANAVLFSELVVGHKKGLRPQDIPLLDASLGLRMLTHQFFFINDYVPLPATTRHHATGTPYYQWHALLYDRDRGRSHKIRFAPYGPPDTIILPPQAFAHDAFEETHERGTMTAMVLLDVWNQQTTGRNMFGTREKPPTIIEAEDHLRTVDDLIQDALTEQMLRLQGYVTPEYSAHPQPLEWFADLPPYIDPVHESHGGALEAAIAELEVHKADDSISPEDLYLLGNLYMEAGLSLVARDTERTAMLAASLERAEDIYHEAREVLPANSSRYFEAAIGEVAAPMYRALTLGENVEEHIDIYCGQLAIVANQMLDAYKNIADKTSPEAEALELLMQLATLYLAVSSSPDRSYVALPGTPRQRGGGNRPRGWDFTLWAYESEDAYMPTTFYGRLDTQPDPKAVDHGVIVLPPKMLGQWTPQHDFITLRTAIHRIDPSLQPRLKKPDKKAFFRAANSIVNTIGG